MSKNCIFTLTAILSLILIQNACAGTLYRVTDLGEIGWGENYSLATGINNIGQIVGTSGAVTTGQYNPFVWQNGFMSDIGTIPAGGRNSTATAINEKGKIVGYTQTDSIMDKKGFLYDSNGMTILNGLPGSFDTEPLDINDGNSIVGISDTSGDLDGFLWENGITYNIVDLPGGTNFMDAVGINNAGSMAGTILDPNNIPTAAILDPNGTVTSLGLLPSGIWSFALALSDSGQVTGYGKNSIFIEHAFYWDGNDINEIPEQSDPNISHALALNNFGEAVGYFEAINDPNAVHHAFIWNDNDEIMRDLNNKLNFTGDGWTLIEATGINDAGQIVGYGYNPAGNIHGFLLTPTDITDVNTTGFVSRIANADFNRDYDVDMFDFAIMALAIPSSVGDYNWNSICDISDPPDGVIDMDDFFAFIEHWGHPIPQAQDILNISPANNADPVILCPILTWQTDPNATSYDVYLGTDFNNVNTALDPNTAPAMANALEPGYYVPQGLLDPNTIYYWRIDPRNNAGITKGDTWRFTTYQTAIDTNLVSLWPLDANTGTTAFDHFGSNHAIIYDPNWVTGKIESGLAFDSNIADPNTMTQFVVAGDSDSLESQTFTLSFWAKLNQPNDPNNGGVAKGYILGSPSQFAYDMSFHDGNAYARVSAGKADMYIPNSSHTAKAPIPDSKWHMWTMTASNGNMAIYMDANFVDSNTYTYQYGPDDLPLIIDYDKGHSEFTIGARDTGEYPINGIIDDVRFYNAVLYIGQMTQLYQYGLYYNPPTKATGPNPPDDPNGVNSVNINTNLAWNNCPDALLYHVYVGTNSVDVNAATVPDYTVTDAFVDPTFNLSYSTSYYWRVDTKNDGVFIPTRGDVWSFQTRAMLDPTIVSLWEFDFNDVNTAVDSVGENHGDVNDANWVPEGQVNGCIEFNGDNGFVFVGDKDNLEQTDFTLSFWAQLDNPSGFRQGGIAKGFVFGETTAYSYKIDFSSGYASCGITNNNDVPFGVSTSIGDSNWHMWTMTVNTTNHEVIFYKDGDEVGRNTLYTGTIDYDKNYNNFIMGARENGLYPMSGQIDDVRLYRRVMAGYEVGTLYNQTSGD